MTQEEKNQYLQILKNFEAINIKEVFIDFYKSTPTDVDSKIVLGLYTVDGLIKASEKIIYNFIKEFNSNGWSSLSNQASHPDFGNRSLPSDLQNFYNQISSKQIDGNLITYIDWLIFYQRANNFWNTSREIIDSENMKNLETDILSKKIIYESIVKEIDLLKKEVETNINSLAKLIEEKTNELQILTDNATNSHTILTELNQTLADGKNKGERLVELVKYSEEKSEEAKNRTEEERKRFEEYRKTHDEFVKILGEKIEGVNASQKNWDEKFSFISEKEAFIKAKEIEINELTGFAAGVSLFHTFQERKRELQTSVDFWKWGIVVISVLVISFISLLFHVNPSTTTNGTSWGIFALNTLKSIPGVILLYFVIKQYNKERAFQEEYAFKSSVSLTVNAFADKLSNGVNSSKDTLIIDSVNKIYETPNSMKEEKGSIFSFRTKPLNDALKNLTEVVKEVKK